jgi:hypothetical protein
MTYIVGKAKMYLYSLTCQKTCLSEFPYIFQAKYIRNKKINENKLVGGTKTWGTIWGSCLRPEYPEKTSH